MSHPTLNLKRAYLALRRALEETVKPFGFTSGQFDVLQLLMHEQEIEHRELQRLLTVASPSLTNILDVLERNGHVRRRTSDEDSRAKSITMTASAREVCYSAAFCEAGDRLVEQMFKGFSAEERAQFQVLLSRVESNLERAWIAAIQPKRVGPLLALVPVSRWGRFAFALISLLAGLATFAGAAVPFVAFFAACLTLSVSLVSAALARMSRASGLWPAPFILVLMSIGVAVIQPLGLKVLALPKADNFPYVPVEAHVVKTYDEGVWFEGIAASPDGTLYLAANRGLEFSRSDYYRDAQGEIIARSPQGEERSIFKTPTGSAAGVIAIGTDGTLYMTSNSDSPGIWRVGKDGKGELFVRLPRGAWPNGLDLGPDGMLYSPDSNLGLIWRADPRTGRFETVLEDKRLLARPFISLAPGANGLHFRGRNMIVTVSDKTTVLEYALKADGSFAEPRIVATGIPGDDFAVGPDGALFVTTHPYNTIVQVSRSGERSIIGNEQQRIVGATDAVFGRGPDDSRTLYVVTDGGAFTGGPKTRGELIALKPYAKQ
eukprot:gene17632-17836_t